MAGSRAYSLSEHELPCTSCISAETLDLPLPLTAQTSCPSRLEFRKALLTRLDLPIDSAKLHLPESPVLIRRLCAQLIDAFRICYMSDQDLYFADSLARELQRRTRQHRLALTKVKAEDGPNRVSAQQNVEVAQIGRSEASHTGRQVDDSQRECFPVLLDDPGLMEEWGLLAGCESPSNLRRALFELKSRLIELTSQSQLKPPQCRQADSKAGGSRTTASHLDNGILSVPKSCDPGSSSDASAIVQPYIRHLQHLINRFCAPANVVMNAEDTDVEFTRRYHDEAERLGVYVHPAVSVIPCGEAGRGLAAGQFIPAGTSLIEVPETAILNVYGALKDPVFGHIARFLLTLQPVQPRSEFQQGVPGGRPTAPEVCQKSPRGNEASRGGLLEGEGEVSGSNREPSSPGGAVRGIERRLMWPSKLDGGDGQDIGDFSASGCQERVSNEGIIFSASEPCPLGTPWVDTDTVCLFYFLFEVEKGDASHYRFFFQEMIPPPRDETQQPLIVGPPEVPEILGDTPLMRTIEDTHLKSFNLYRQLIPLLKETFASPGLSPALGETGSPLREQVSRYIDSLTLQKCIWAQSVMGSRAFSVKIPPPAVLPGWRLDTGLAEVEEDSQGGQGRLTNCLPGEEAAADGDNRRSEPEFSEARSGVYAKRVCIRQDDGEEDSRSGQDEKVEVRHESSRLENADEEETVVPFLPALRERCNNSPLYRVRVSSSCSPTADATERRSAEDGALVCVPDHPTSFLLFTDMMNHHVHAQCAFPYFDEQTRRACVVAQADIPAGAQLYIFYGPMQSWELLAHYGFTTNNFFSFGRGVSATATGTAGETGACCGDWSFTREREGTNIHTAQRKRLREVHTGQREKSTVKRVARVVWSGDQACVVHDRRLLWRLGLRGVTSSVGFTKQNCGASREYLPTLGLTSSKC